MKIFFIINGGRAPVAAPLINSLRALLDDAGADYRLEVSLTLEESNAYVAQAQAGGYDTLWMGGGDGTIHVLLNQALFTGLHLGVVPMGTVNALARALGIPLHPEAAVRYLLKATPRPMNVGRVNGERRFLCFAGVGFDAAVVHDVSGLFKRFGGRAAYALAGLRRALRLGKIPPFTLELPSDAVPVNDPGAPPHGQRGYSLVLSNIRNYAGFNLFPQAHPCGHAMEMWVFRNRRIDAMSLWIGASVVGWEFFRRRLRRNVGHYRVRDFVVTSHEPMILQLDGEAVILGDGRRYEFEFCEGAVSIMM